MHTPSPHPLDCAALPGCSLLAGWFRSACASSGTPTLHPPPPPSVTHSTSPPPPHSSSHPTPPPQGAALYTDFRVFPYVQEYPVSIMASKQKSGGARARAASAAVAATEQG